MLSIYIHASDDICSSYKDLIAQYSFILTSCFNQSHFIVHFGSLSRLYRQQQGRSGIFLIVCPATVLQHWLKELRRWVPEMRCVIMHTISKTGGELHKLGEEGELTSS
jgi:SNF2 family DNA or RNA helicase